MKENLKEMKNRLDKEYLEEKFHTTLDCLKNYLPNDFLDTYAKEDIGKRISDELKRHNATQKELALTLDTSKSSVSKWIRGEGLTIDVILKLSILFHCSTDYLIHGNMFNCTPLMIDLYKAVCDCEHRYNTAKSISMKNVFEFFVKDEMGDSFDCNKVNLEFFYKLANYFALDVGENDYVQIDDENRRISYSINQQQLEELELLNIMKILKEKKARFKETAKAKSISKDNQKRSDNISECCNPDEIEYIKGGNL